ncbi:NlpC/P60 family protein [Gordonia insulae]|uniref:Peptidoglycan endopeptidase RipA n=1 Tax=Gordonia insulae TaxID=2420509 RepID=A0A3G8JIQ4_9ACTN|nr:NlpC/P60 family protein [Gordonia insulae]AZG44349.1 Peptidoglycan endopeptidase RipA [Gordonia insulae]
MSTPPLARLCALMVIVVLGAIGAGQANAAPRGQSGVSGLINQIAKANQNIADLDNAVAVRQENVNRALVDYQNSVAAQNLATVAAGSAKRSLDEAARRVARAQESFDKFARDVYRQGSAQGSMSNYVSSDNPQSVLDRITVLDRVGKQQRDTIERLQVARNQQANRVAAVQATKRQAAFATKSAATRKDDALAAVAQARTAAASEQQRRTDLMRQRDKVQASLDKIRGVAPRREVADPTVNDLLKNLFPESPGTPSTPGTPAAPGTGGDNQALAVAAEAAAKLALDVGQKVLAGVVGRQQLPHSQLLDELGIGGSDMTGSGADSLSSTLSTGSLGSLFGSSSGGGGGMVRPGLRGPQAVEITVNRALSQLNVPYAWGGGDGNGPTRGIRDGGVADSYGDYNKTGFDCSGLMIYAFAGVGIDLPHYTGYQYTSGPQFPLSQMRRGDMIFYGPNASQHVALYLGDNKMVEAPQSGDVVKVSPLRTAGAMPNVVRLL